jgi:hypothetical protein
MMITSAADEIVSSKRVLMKRPGVEHYNELYPTKNQVSTQLAEVQNAHGKLRASTNNLNLGATSNFTISAYTIVGNWCLHAALTLGANRGVNNGWLLQAIDQVDVTFSNSLLQSVTLSGLAIREYLLYTCDSKEKRKELLDDAGKAGSGVGVYRGSMPIGNLILSAIGQQNQFPIDMSTLSGNVQVNVRFANAGAFTTNIGAGVTSIPTAFTSLEMTCDTSTLLSSAFSVKNALAFQPGSSYNIPTKYVTSSNIPLTNFDPASGVENSVQLANVPSGMLEAIILCLKPNTEFKSVASAAAANSTYFPIGGSVNIKTLRLEYSGDILFRADSAEELKSNYRSVFCGDMMEYEQYSHTYTPSGPGPMSVGISKYEGRVIVIPFTFRGNSVKSSHLLENLPSYGGSTLDLRFTVDDDFQREEYLAAAPFARTNQVVVGSGGAIPWTLQTVYVLSSLVEISAGVVDLQL